MNKVEHPGVYLLERLKELDLKQSDLVELTGINQAIISQIITGKRDINPKYAVLFEQFLDVPAETWLQKQNEFDIQEQKSENEL